MEVTMNGPILVEADPVIKTSMNRYWNGKRWHFKHYTYLSVNSKATPRVLIK